VRIDIPGFGTLRLEHLVLDYNGTIAVDGSLLPGVRTRLAKLARELEVHIVTADTFGRVRVETRAMKCRLAILAPRRQARAKLAYVRKLGASRTVCIGNGRNDRLMLKAAALGIAVVHEEGASAEALRAADIATRDVRDALDLLRERRRLVATLRD
jgi:soluble P-type ATPase